MKCNINKDGEYYSVGEASSICNVSKKAMRFYDKIAIISPDMIGENEYRYYSWDTLLAIPIVKYYKQMGFKLNEMRGFIQGGTYEGISSVFREKLAELSFEETKIRQQCTSIKDWYDLIIEAMMVIGNHAVEVGVKYYEKEQFCCLEQPYNPNYKDAIINIPFTNYIESIKNEITGPVIRHFEDFKDKMAGVAIRQSMLQKTILPCCDGQAREFGGAIMLSCYHIGSHDSLNCTYERIIQWADIHNYQCGPNAWERYVTDYWTLHDESQFVTEVIVEASR